MPTKNCKRLLLLLLHGIALTSHAQEGTTIGQVSISSPTAASLGKYGDIPVNYHTGIPQISIPIYTVKSGGLSLPISLSYHASGVKVQEQASWVGAGFSLSAGGVITRNVVGAADDKGYKGYNGFYNACGHGHFSDYGFNSYLMQSDAGSVLPDFKRAMDEQFLSGERDGEPDMFFFNFGGYSGKFYFNDDRTPVLVPEQDIKIQPDYILGPGFNGFIVTTPDGVKYYFGRTGNYSSSADPVEATIPSTIDNGPSNSSAAASSWYLNKVVSADKTDSITFNYQSESYSYYTWAMFPVADYGGTGMSATISGLNGVSLVKNFVDGVRLTGIGFSNGNIVFTPAASARTDLTAGYGAQSGIYDQANTSAYALGSISITDNNGFCKKDSLYYSYFHDNVNTNFHNTFWGEDLDNYSLTSDSYLLRLDSLQETTCNQAIQVPPYKFSYFSEFVPRRLSFGIDHWGFYNGVSNNKALIPTHSVQYQGKVTQQPGANRDPAWPAMRGGSLQTIIYPLGGKTQFEFEPHYTYCNYYDYVSTTRSSRSAGYTTFTGNPDTSHLTFSANTYRLILSNDATGGSAQFTITEYGTGNYLLIQNTSAGHTDTVDFVLTPGTYKMTLLKNSASTGHGCSAIISEMVPTAESGNFMVGGLRVKTITSSDSLGSPPMITKYSYNVSNNPTGSSSGILYSRPAYTKLVKNDIFNFIFPYGYPHPYCNILLCAAPTGGFCANASEQYYKSPASVRPMSTTQGEHIGYNEVYVTRADSSYSVFRYYGSNSWDNVISDVCIRDVNWDNPCDTLIPNTPAPPVPFEFMRGELKYEGHYTKSGHIVKDIWHYPVFQPGTIITPAIIHSNANNNNLFVEYSLQSARRVSDSTAETIYDQFTDRYITNSRAVYYTSPYHHQPVKQLSYASGGDSLTSFTKYAYDFRVASADSLDTGIKTYADSLHADSVVLVNTLSTCTPQSSGMNYNENCRYIGYQQFRENISNHRISYVQTRRTNFVDSANRFDSLHLVAENGADSWLKPVLRLQDEYNNAAIETSGRRNQKLLQAGITKYDTSVSPIGFAYPGKTQTLNLAVPSSSFSNAAVTGSSISRDSRYTDESSFKFSAGKPVETTAKNGVVTSYVWDYKNTIPVAKVVNADTASIAYTSFEADGKGRWSIPSALRDSSSAITGRKCFDMAHGNLSAAVTNGSYVISFWANHVYTVTASQFDLDLGYTTNLTLKTGRTVNGWTYYEGTADHCYQFTINSPGVTFGVTYLIDELRVYPKAAQMTTYTYDPLVGMTSTANPACLITYYEYDGLARLKNIKDYQGNIIQNYQYNYANSCGDNCVVLPMQTFTGSNTLSYPVGVFNVNGRLLGNASSQSAYITLWMSDTANSHIGTLTAGADSMHFHLALEAGKTPPGAVTGLRYYQFDLSYTLIDAIRNNNGAYVDFGDSTGMRLGKSIFDTVGLVLAPNTTINYFSYPGHPPYFKHSYSDSSAKTITLYHNDSYGYETMSLDNYSNPATSLTRVKNLRGNLPQYCTDGISGSCFQDSTFNTVSNIINWNSITTITKFGCNSGDGVTPWKNLRFAQDFMQNNRGLSIIFTIGYNYYSAGYRDSTFKISRLKSDWNTYFTALTDIQINDEHWNREDLSALTNLKMFALLAGNQKHSNDSTSNPVIPIPSSVIDAVLNQISAGAGQSVTNGTIVFITGGTSRTSASDTAVTNLLSKDWAIYFNGVRVTP